MKRSIVASSSKLPNASVKASRIRMEPVAPYSHSMMAMPCHTSTRNASSLSVLKAFWDNLWNQLQYFTGFNCYLPLSRVKKILKTDPKVRISRDAPALFSKACEYLILELTLRAWMHSIMHSNKSFASLTIQGVLEHAEPEKVLPPAKMILPDMNVANDMNQIKQENRIDKPFSDHKGFDLNSISRYSYGTCNHTTTAVVYRILLVHTL
ncbi:hypothetical protein Bca101_038526 [Brassica carinata]